MILAVTLGEHVVMTTQEQARNRARVAYHAAADNYDHAALSFWEKFGRATVSRLELRPDARVLDVCCGSGASALPTAAAVAPHGRVIGVDLADGLLELARAKAEAARMTNVEFKSGDIAEIDFSSADFDAVVCVFGVFFFPDMPAAIRRWWDWVKPGGQLAITTWGPRLFEPANSIFWQAVREVRPELYKSFNPWDRINEPAALNAVFEDGGVKGAGIRTESTWHPLRSENDWWTIVMGSGYRGVVDQLTPAEVAAVRSRALSELSLRGIRAIEANVVYAVAVKR